MPQDLQRPVPLVCQHCNTIIAAGDPCNFTPVAAPPGSLELSRGFIGAHDDCPTNAFDHWSTQRIISNPLVFGGEAYIPGTSLTVAEIATRRNNGDTPAQIIADYPFLTALDIDFSVQFDAL